MEAKHTPGPWHFVEREKMEDGSIYPAHIIGGVTQLQICLMEISAVAEAIVNDPAWHALAKSEMSHANASLIATAPELLEALKVAVRQNEHDMQMTGEELRAARAVIAKATPPHTGQ